MQWLILVVLLMACDAGDPGHALNHDPQLCHDLMHALAPGHVLFDEGYPQLDCAIVAGEMTVDIFRSRASGVQDWDIIAVVGPYSHGEDLADDPLLAKQSESVRRVITHTEGWVNDGIFNLTLVRQGVIVGGLWLRMEGRLPENFIVERE